MEVLVEIFDCYVQKQCKKENVLGGALWVGDERGRLKNRK